MKKKSLLILLLIYIVFLMCACGNNGADGEQNQQLQTPISSNQDDFRWKIKGLDVEISDNLANTQTFIKYDGVAEEIPYTKVPTEGSTFLLIELSIDKQEAGGNSFAWEDVYVEDSEENRYYRLKDDKFLEDYNLPRIKGTDLTIGGNTGFICFEIPIGTDISTLNFVHVAEEGQNTIALQE